MTAVPLSAMLAEIAPLVIGVHGDSDRAIVGVAPLGKAASGRLTFCRHPGAALLGMRASLGGSVVFCPEGTDSDAELLQSVTLVVVTNPRLAFMRALQKFFPPARPPAGVDRAAVVDEGAVIDPSASIGAGCYVGPDVSIGAGTILFPNVAVYCPATIGRNVKVHGGTVIGADGFGYERNDAGQLESFPHVGGVVIEDDVEIGANSCIDRGTLADTMICRGARIDNLVHISHNVHVGCDAVVIANSMIGGSVHIGDRVWIAPSVGVLNQKRIGADATVGFGAMVVKDVADGDVVMGVPAVTQAQFRKTQAAIKQLTERDQS